MTGCARRTKLGLARQEFVDARRHLALLLHAEHEVHALHPCNLASLQLRIATDDNDSGVGMLAMQAVDGLAALLVGRLGDATSIDDAHVGHFALTDGANALGFQLVAERRSFREVEFAAQGDVGGALNGFF